MLSRPDNADISQYQQYRQGYAAKYSAGADGKLEKQKSSPGAPGAGEQAGMETSPNDKVYIILFITQSTRGGLTGCFRKIQNV